MTNRPGKRESAVIMSSVMPSLKYSWSRSPLMLAKGSTAIEGLSGNVRAGLCGGIDAVVLGERSEREGAAPQILAWDDPFGLLARRRGSSSRLDKHPVDPYWLGDILDRLRAEVLVAQRQLAAELFMDTA